MSDRMRTSFAMIPGWVITRVTSGIALRIYTHLAWKYADTERHAFPSEQRLAEELGCGLRTVQRALTILRDQDALIVTRSRKSDGHYGRNVYRLPMDDPRDTPTKPSGDPPERHVDADHADQQEPSVSAAQHQPPPQAAHHPPPQAGREPDPQEQPDKEKLPSSLRDDGDSPQRSCGAATTTYEDPNEDPNGPLGYPKAWDEQDAAQQAHEDRVDRYMARLDAEVDWFEARDEAMAWAMLTRDEPYRKVLNTIRKNHRQTA
ncbi:MAG: helix-turn-helix domain-containing protein [Pseudonocardiaceae bacterium]